MSIIEPGPSVESREPATAAAEPELRLRDLRPLRGPNLWRAAPVVTCDLVVAGVGPGHLALLAGLATLPPDGASEAAASPAAAVARALAALAVAVQQRAGSAVHWWRTVAGHPADGGDGELHVVCVEYEEEEVAMAAVREAAALVRLVLAGGMVPGDAAPGDEAAARLRALRERVHLGPTATVLVQEARRRGIPVRRTPGEHVVQLGLGCRRHRLDATLTDRTSVIATDITSDKDRTKRVLARLGIPVPRGGVALTADEAVEIAEDVGYPVLVKPLDANNGRGISPRLDDAEGVRQAFGLAHAEHPQVVVERFVEGRDHRVLVVQGRVIAVTERLPAHVTGDGRRTIAELAEEANRDPQRSKTDPDAPLAPLPLDDLTRAFLARGGRTLDTVPAAGETVYLRSTANISTGGIAVDRTDEIHPDNAAICAFAADVTGLDVAGIDVLTPDIAVPFGANGATIIEVNASPGIRMHTDPQRGVPRDVPGAILDMLYPPGAPSRIPVVAVTGTNGKTTTTRLVAHLLRAAGHRVGMTTTDAVYWQEHVLMEGDMTGPMAADMVLSHPRVDAAVLETARGGILRSGLGFEACDVAVVLNVSADHLGLRGIHTVEQLAEVKRVLVTAVRPDGWAVLVADDPLVAAMRDACAGGVILVSTGGSGAALVAGHVRAGGRAVTLEPSADGAGEAIVLHDGPTRTPLVRAADVPLALGGAARFQLQNAAAASAAAWACGVAPAVLGDALRRFVSSPATTPGRMNVLQVREATVVVDYAHNAAAVSALLDYAARVEARRRIGVLAIPGDRRDEDIRHFGALAVPLDVAVFKEHPDYLRGRRPGEIAALMRDGLRAAGGDESRAVDALDEDEAIAAVLALLQPGDLVLFVADEPARVVAEMTAANGARRRNAETAE